MKFHGREIDPVSFWEKYVDFPPWLKEADHAYAPLAFCPNPDHDNFHTPAFQVNLRSPLVHCFSNCGISGSYEHAVALCEGLYEKFKVEEATDKRERSRRIRRAHRAAKKMILTNAKPTTVRISSKPRPVAKAKMKMKLEYESFLPPVGFEYLAKRGIDGAEISFWELGWDSDEKRIVIPAYDEDRRLKFLIKRAIWEKQQPKYLYSENVEKTQVLFGADKLPGEMKSIVLVEGAFDAIRLHQHGISAVAILGTGISDRQVRVLSIFRPKRVYLMFDRDAAGIRNIEIAYEKLRRYPLFVCTYPRKKYDPAELTRQEVERSLEKAIPILIWRRKVRSLRKRIRFDP